GDGVIIRENCELKVDEEDELMHVIGMGIIDQSSEKEPEGWKDFTFSPAVRWFTVEQFDLIGSGAALTQDDLPPAPRILEPVTEELWTRVMGMDMPSSNTPPAPSEPIFTSLLKDSQARCWLFKLPFVWDKDLHLDTFIEEIEQDMWFGQTVRDVQGDRIPEKGDVVVIRENCDLAREEPDGNMHIIGLGIIDRSCEDMPEDWETNTDREAVRWFSVGKFSKIGNGKTVSQKDLSPAPRILEPITKKKLSELLS
ncbi:MAG: hypothetical protein QGG50_06185, partial [Methanopyri archaeon]|nr:hypothetical protein [Methanopyri archaeon]